MEAYGEDSNQGYVSPRASEKHDATYPTGTEQDRYLSNQIPGQASNSKTRDRNAKGAGRSRGIGSPPICPRSGDRGLRASQPISVSAACRIRRAQTGRQEGPIPTPRLKPGLSSGCDIRRLRWPEDAISFCARRGKMG